MKKTILVFRLHSEYSQSNRVTLWVSLRPDSVLTYSAWGGHQDSGIGESMSNFQFKESLPIDSRKFKTVKALETEIRRILRTGVGSKDVLRLDFVADDLKVEDWMKK